jgi:uncharacterized protein DUF6084
VSATQHGSRPDAGLAPTLAFAVDGAQAVEHAAVPTLSFALRIDSPGGRPIRSIMLDVQIQIAARRRRYDAGAQERLFGLFGAPQGWGTALRTLLWTRTTVVVPPFEETTTIQVPVGCTYDLEVSASQYFDALRDGEVPLEFLFSGSIFYAAEGGALQIARVPWDHEAGYRLPVGVWKEAMERHFPGCAWVRLGRESFDRLSAYRSRHALAGWDDAIDALLDEREER